MDPRVRYRFQSYVLDLYTRELLRDGLPVPLPARVFECLCCLIQHRDRAVGRDELARAVFARADVSDVQLAQVVLRSRRALGDDGQKQHTIRTVPRYGFRWVAPVQTDAGAVAVPEAAPSPPRLPQPPSAAAGVRRRWWPLLEGALLAVFTAGLAALWWYHGARGERSAGEEPEVAAAAQAPAREALVVLPLRVPQAVAPWARLGLMDYLGTRARQSGLPALASETLLGVLGDTPAAALDPDQLRRSTRAGWIVDGEAVAGDGQWQVRLRATDAQGLVQRGQARGSDLLETARIAGDRLFVALGGRPPADAGTEPALEERLQRAQAAMLANELDTARDILLQAPELQRAQPQLRYRLAQVDFRAGQYRRGLATLDELLAAPALAGDALFQARLQTSRGSMLVRMDRYAEAERSYDRAVALLQDTGSPLELGNALNGRGVTRSAQGRFDAALQDLGRARALLMRGGDALAVARVDANLGNVEMDRERPAQARDYFDKALRDFESMGAVNELAAIRSMLVTVQLQLLQPRQALMQSARLWALLPRIRDPAQRANIVLARAEALIADGRLDQAGQLLRRDDAVPVVPGDYRRREFLGIELARQAGRADAVLQQAEAALRDWPPDRRPALRGWVQLREMQAARQLQRRPPLPGGTVSTDVPGQLVRALAASSSGRQREAEDAYRAALELATRRAIPAEIAAAVEAYAGWLLSRGEAAAASGVAGRAAAWTDADFRLAALQAALHRGLGQRSQAQAAQARALQLAGERPLPPFGDRAGH